MTATTNGTTDLITLSLPDRPLSDADIARITAALRDEMVEILTAFDIWLTVEETCQVLKVSDATLVQWERAGLLMPSRVGSRIVRYSRHEISAFMAAQKGGN